MTDMECGAKPAPHAWVGDDLRGPAPGNGVSGAAGMTPATTGAPGPRAGSDSAAFEAIGDRMRETPFFVLSRDQVLENLERMQKALPTTTIHYAVKANSEPAVLATLAGAGACFEIASAFEMELLRRLGVSHDRILFGSAVKPSPHIRQVFGYGVDRFAVDSAPELEKIAADAPGARIYVRVRVDDAESVFPFSEKFGARPSAVEGLFLRARALGLRPYGLSFHVGSQSMRAGAWGAAVASLALVIRRLSSIGMAPQVLNIGGGFPCQYDTGTGAPTIEEIGEHVRDAVDDAAVDASIVAEPGRFLVASAAVLVATVIGRVERENTTWLFADAGCYNGLFEAMSYQGATRYAVRRNGKSTVPAARFSIAGPTGDSADVIARGAVLPADTGLGHRLVFANAGAYSMSMSIPFNGFPKPAVCVV